MQGLQRHFFVGPRHANSHFFSSEQKKMEKTWCIVLLHFLHFRFFFSPSRKDCGNSKVRTKMPISFQPRETRRRPHRKLCSGIFSKNIREHNFRGSRGERSFPFSERGEKKEEKMRFLSCPNSGKTRPRPMLPPKKGKGKKCKFSRKREQDMKNKLFHLVSKYMVARRSAKSAVSWFFLLLQVDPKIYQNDPLVSSGFSHRLWPNFEWDPISFSEIGSESESSSSALTDRHFKKRRKNPKNPPSRSIGGNERF